MKPTAHKNRSAGLPGRGQLTLVEHALCPLDSNASLVDNLVHEASYFFMDGNRSWSKARARVNCPGGLSASDEFYLWGLLALTFLQQGNDRELYATPHYCLTRLGVVDEQCRSGRHYRLFANSVKRLAAVHYQNDHFYDPIRSEHREVGFGFFSYSLPLDPKSNRAWRIAWDPVFFEFAQATSGHLHFDLVTYRKLDPASRRLFLLLSKIFYRRSITPSFELRHLAVDVLGFCPRSPTRQLKRKVARCVHELQQSGIVADDTGQLVFRKKDKGRYTLTLTRGRYFASASVPPTPGVLFDSPLREPLQRIGFEDGAISALLRKYPCTLLREWTDITLAAIERKGRGFFKKSPAAYFRDNLKHAAQGTRTSPDWWRELRKSEVESSARRRVVSLPVSSMHGQVQPAREVLSRVLKEAGLPIAGGIDEIQQEASPEKRIT